MGLKNTQEGWGWPARALHWLIAAVMIGTAGIGLWAAQFEPDMATQISQTQLHKSFGFTVFCLGLIRIVWRLMNPAPPLPAGTPQSLKLAAHAGHLALYGLMIALPVTGWLMATSSPLQDYPGIPNRVFGLFDMPDPFVPGDKAVSELFNTIHTGLAIALGIVLAGHVGAALKHHLVDRDRVLMRMIKGR